MVFVMLDGNAFFLDVVIIILICLILRARYEQGNTHNSLKHSAEDVSGPPSPMSVPAQKQLKYTPGIANGPMRKSAAFIDHKRKVHLLFHPLLLDWDMLSYFV